MGIRDSCRSVSPGRGRGLCGRHRLRRGGRALRGNGPVSYTHLDVYKRQVYGYHSYNHYERDESLYIHRPDDSLSAAENLLRMLRPDKSYTDLEADVYKRQPMRRSKPRP